MASHAEGSIIPPAVSVESQILQNAEQAQAGASEHETTISPAASTTRSTPMELNDLAANAPEVVPQSAPTTTHALLNRTETAELALGPDGQPAAPFDSSTPTLRMTLMLTTGARHAYTISQKYLASRKVDAQDSEGNFDPREMSGYKLKELIWTDWRAEWEPRPRDPSAIRLIIMGRMIDDKVALKDLPFNLSSTNVVHMTIKPADLLDDEVEGAGKHNGKGSIRAHSSGGDAGAGCRCVIL